LHRRRLARAAVIVVTDAAVRSICFGISVGRLRRGPNDRLQRHTSPLYDAARQGARSGWLARRMGRP
jgi:hypothetical protein